MIYGTILVYYTTYIEHCILIRSLTHTPARKEREFINLDHIFCFDFIDCSVMLSGHNN